MTNDMINGIHVHVSLLSFTSYVTLIHNVGTLYMYMYTVFNFNSDMSIIKMVQMYRSIDFDSC